MKINKTNLFLFLIVLAVIFLVVIIFNRVSTTGSIITGKGFFDIFKGSSDEQSSNDEGGKPASVVGWSNGYPSGPHETLIIHGHKEDFFESGGSCAPTKKGKVVNIPEYGEAEIQMMQNKDSDVRKLVVVDPCSTSPSDPAKIQLPYGKYQVYARALGKPTHKTDTIDRKIILYPELVDVCNDYSTSSIPGSGDFIDCSEESLYGIGLLTATTAFETDSIEFTRIPPIRGNNKAQEITDMFQWTGYACDISADTNGDGEITIDDAPEGIDDLTLYLESECSYFENEWIFNIADLVVYGWDAYNEGVKNFKVRFYPVISTEFCGDDVCAGDEDCLNCPQDCGECPTFCGNEICDGEETCETCPGDCGVCPPVCGDEVCDIGIEDCEICQEDCGECPPVCGDEICEGTETCNTCPEDCGTCPIYCGDGTCDIDEDCGICPDDCGVCPPICGNGLCDATETCAICQDDCGICTVCGDEVCEGDEIAGTCPQDCL